MHICNVLVVLSYNLVLMVSDLGRIDTLPKAMHLVVDLTEEVVDCIRTLRLVSKDWFLRLSFVLFIVKHELLCLGALDDCCCCRVVSLGCVRATLERFARGEGVDAL